MTLHLVRLLLILTFAGPAFADGGVSQGTKAGPDCYCTDGSGERWEMGDVICVALPGRQFLARCEMSLNSPTWRDLETECLGATLLPDRGLGVLDTVGGAVGGDGFYLERLKRL